MTSAGMIRIAREDTDELAYDVRGTRVRGPVRMPVIPWTKIHQRFGIQCRSIEIIWIAVSNIFHRLRIHRIQPGSIGRWVRLVTLGERFDVGAFMGGGVG